MDTLKSDLHNYWESLSSSYLQQQERAHIRWIFENCKEIIILQTAIQQDEA